MKVLSSTTDRVCLVGDIHGDFGVLGIAARVVDADVPIIQVGDFGMGFVTPPKNIDAENGIFFIRGNHDDPAACRQHSSWICDGYVEEEMMFVGGAYSIDWKHRTPGVSWWEDEQISYEEMDAIEKTYRECRPSIMITHDLPSTFISETWQRRHPYAERHMTRTGEFLSHLHLIHQPKLWVGGHWHESIREEYVGTDFIILGRNEAVVVNRKDFSVTNLFTNEDLQE